jgi:hypothetical protein
MSICRQKQATTSTTKSQRHIAAGGTASH